MNYRDPCQAGPCGFAVSIFPLRGCTDAIDGCGCLFYGFVSGLRVVVNEWVCLCVRAGFCFV